MLVYGSGFLCEYTFLDHFGIQESGQDFFRTRFLHVGILFLLFPVSILIPGFFSISLKKSELKAATNDDRHSTANTPEQTEPKEGTQKFSFPISTMLTFFNISLVFYLFLFTPHNFIYAKGIFIPAIIAISFLVPLAIDIAVNTLILHRLKARLTLILRWTMLVVGIGSLDFILFKDFSKQLLAIFWGDHWFPSGGVYYLFFMMLIPWTLWRNNVHVKRIDDPRHKAELRIVGISLSLMFLFLGIVTFAIRLYPWIPVAKGGGNYSENAVVTISFSDKNNNFKTNGPIYLGLTISNCFTIIERTPNSLFLADTNDAGGPHEWQKMLRLPRITEIRSDMISHVVYTRVVESNLYSIP
jgi:hypothetical protein